MNTENEICLGVYLEMLVLQARKKQQKIGTSKLIYLHLQLFCMNGINVYIGPHLTYRNFLFRLFFRSCNSSVTLTYTTHDTIQDTC